ncbi:MAG: MFS transporter [Chloroflexi bacterium]|nr:MFS transporter [Chloroflexota bacterium]
MPVERWVIPILDSEQVKMGMFHFYNDSRDLVMVNSANIMWIKRDLDNHNANLDQFVHSMQNQLSVFARDVLNGDALTLGYLGAAMGVGSLVATFTVASLGNFRSRGMLNMSSIILVTVTLFVFGLSSRLALSLVIIGVLGFFNTSSRLANNALVHSRVPDALRGRVTSIYAMDHGFQPVGSLSLGLLASSEVLGPQRTVAIAGLVAIAVTVFIGLRFWRLWRLN